MGWILKALGMTIWGLIAFGLLGVFVFVGFEMAIKSRSSVMPVSMAIRHDTQDSSARDPSLNGESELPASSLSYFVPPTPSSLPAVIETKLRAAVQARQYDKVIEYGLQLADSDAAGEDDLMAVAQAYSSLNDCAHARVWAERSRRWPQRAGPASALSAPNLSACPFVGDRPSGVVVRAEHQERFERLRRSIGARAQADLQHLPLMETEASKSASGNLYVKLGELYYGFGDYSSAIECIRRGLAKGRVQTLDLAYVYLGLAQQAMGADAEAREAFAQLKTVPGINPRVLSLWTLYAEVNLNP